IDLDYKGLSNSGSWFIGRLQTKQDKERVMDGLVKGSEGSLNKKEIEQLLSNIQSRVFLFKSAHEDRLKLMQTRWVLSYLRGPLSKKEVRKLMKDKKGNLELKEKPETQKKLESEVKSPGKVASNVIQPIISNDVEQYYSVNTPYGKEVKYEPWLLAEGKVKFVNATRGIDIEKSFTKRLYLNKDMTNIDLRETDDFSFDTDLFDKRPLEQSKFYSLPAFIEELKSFKSLEKDFSDYLYRSNKLELYKCTALKAESKPGETIRDFKIKITGIIRDKKAEAVEKLRKKYSTKGDRLQDKYARLRIKLQKEKSDVSAKQTDTAMSLGMAVLGSFLGSGSKSKAMRGITSAGKISKEKADVRRVENEMQQVQKDMQELKNDLSYDIDMIKQEFDIENYKIATFYIKPRKTDVHSIKISLFWEAR
ncbi:MAG: hypothetical protein ABFS35_21825, partial [Bacteroidota bacterium]